MFSVRRDRADMLGKEANISSGDSRDLSRGGAAWLGLGTSRMELTTQAHDHLGWR